MNVWYNLSGDNSFTASNAPNASLDIHLTSIDKLQFRATGDFIASGSNDCVVIDNIRTAATWDEVTDPVVDWTAAPELIVSISGSLGDAMEVGQTNLITVTISNSGGPAIDVTTTLTHNGGGGFSIISSNNAAVSLAPNQSVDQTYEVVAYTEGSYVLTARATSAEVNSAPATFGLRVGSRISLFSAVVTNDIGGIVPGEVEPGETFDLIITSVNDGATTVENITNSLSVVNPVYFPSIIATNSGTYALMNVGATTSTTYRVTCSSNTPNGLQTFTVVNRTADDEWTKPFQVNVRREAIPSVSPTNLTLHVFAGEMNSGTVTVSNIGNAAGDLRVLIPSSLSAAQYVETETSAEGLYDAFGPWSLFTNWSGTKTVSLGLGFSFAPFGTAYSTFSVSQFGTITLGGSSGTATLKPFETGTAVAQSTIRYNLTGDRLIVAWGNGTGQEFQAWINANGTVLYLYQYGTWGAGTIGAVINNNNQVFTHPPGQTGRDGLLLTPTSWVTASPSSKTIGIQESQVLTLTANPSSGKSASTNIVPVTIELGGISVAVQVTVVVHTGTPTLGVSIVPNPLTFSGPAGVRTRTTATITNTGNVAVSYTLRDSGLKSASYTVMTNQSDFGSPGVYPLSGSDLDTRSVDIGFPVTFFGSVYTNLIVGLDGTLTLGTQKIIPFSASLTTNSGSSIRYSTNLQKTEFTVSWNQMIQPGGADKQTFHAMLYRETGEILFYYDQLLGNWTNGAIKLVGDASTVKGSLINAETVSLVTNIVKTVIMEPDPDIPGWYRIVGTNYMTNVVTTVYNANRQSLTFIPGKPQVISVSPLSGELPVGGSAELTVTGDARSLTAGGSNPVTVSTTFDAVLKALYQSANKTNASVSTVTFSATNSVETAYASPLVRAAMWGSDNPVVDSTLNADGSRTLSWPEPTGDDLSRTYTVWYTTNLSEDWIFVDTVKNDTIYLDDDSVRMAESVIFYRVTVQ
jgi:hypothetical protein